MLPLKSFRKKAEITLGEKNHWLIFFLRQCVTWYECNTKTRIEFSYRKRKPLNRETKIYYVLCVCGQYWLDGSSVIGLCGSNILGSKNFGTEPLVLEREEFIRFQRCQSMHSNSYTSLAKRLNGRMPSLHSHRKYNVPRSIETLRNILGTTSERASQNRGSFLEQHGFPDEKMSGTKERGSSSPNKAALIYTNSRPFFQAVWIAHTPMAWHFGWACVISVFVLSSELWGSLASCEHSWA